MVFLELSLVVMPLRHRPQVRLLPRLNHDELPHHPFIFVEEHVAVVHVRQGRIRVPAELHNEGDG